VATNIRDNLVFEQPHLGNPDDSKLHSPMLHVKKSKKSKVDVSLALVPHSGCIFAPGFDKSEWEIMYQLFVSEGIYDTSEGVDRESA
jgi:hypothetical protein